MMLNILTRVLALVCLVTAVIASFAGNYPMAAYLMGMAVFNQLLAQEAA